MVKFAGMLNVKSFTFNPFQENTYVLYDDTKECVIIDPGCYEKAEEQELANFIEENGLTVKFLLNTHCHIDHVLGNYFVKKKYNVDLCLHPIEEQVLKAVETYAPNYGFNQYSTTSGDSYLKEGEQVLFGDQALEIIFAPGHSPGHVCFYSIPDKILIGGDVLFRNSIGRTDLPGGDHDTLIESIHEKLFILPDDVVVYCGHGPETTIGYEKETNQFCAIR